MRTPAQDFSEMPTTYEHLESKLSRRAAFMSQTTAKPVPLAVSAGESGPVVVLVPDEVTRAEDRGGASCYRPFAGR